MRWLRPGRPLGLIRPGESCSLSCTCLLWLWCLVAVIFVPSAAATFRDARNAMPPTLCRLYFRFLHSASRSVWGVTYAPPCGLCCPLILVALGSAVGWATGAFIFVLYMPPPSDRAPFGAVVSHGYLSNAGGWSADIGGRRRAVGVFASPRVVSPSPSTLAVGPFRLWCHQTPLDRTVGERPRKPAPP